MSDPSSTKESSATAVLHGPTARAEFDGSAAVAGSDSGSADAPSDLAIRDTVSPPPPASSASPSPQSASPAEEERVLAGRYRLVRLLGKGGMGAVYQAEHVHMRKAVALKLLHREMTVLPEVVARFEREAVAAARIEHPNVAAATDFGRLEDGTFYLVLEYVEGRSLSDALDAEGPFEPPRAVHIARQVAEALAAAHAAGIVHRDLKPDNIMLVERDGDREFAKVLDFGIAKLGDATEGQQKLTQAGAVFGTPEYMSPEQAKGDVVDARSDLYALGMILYEMLAGKTAFAADELIVVLTKHLTAEPPPLPGTVPAPLRKLVERLLRKDPADRVQTAAELAALLRDFEGTGLQGSGALAEASFGLFGTNSRWSAGGSAWGRHLGVVARVARQVPTVLVRRARIGGRSVPLWAFGLPALLLGMALTIAVLGRGSSDAKDADPSLTDRARRLATAVLDPELPKLLARARQGDREALGEVRRRAEQEGSVDLWKALGRGYAEIQLLPASVEAYARAAALSAKLDDDEEFWRDLREAVEHEDAREQAVELAATALGPKGVDFLDVLYRETQGVASKASLAALLKPRVTDPSFDEGASPALRVARALERAKTCTEVKDLLPEAVEHADERALRRLRGLTFTRGCGFLSLKDCHPCLRAPGVPLKEAIDAAAQRPAPRFARRETARPAAGAPAASAAENRP